MCTSIMMILGGLLTLVGVYNHQSPVREAAPGIWLDKTEHVINNGHALAVTSIGIFLVACGVALELIRAMPQQ